MQEKKQSRSLSQPPRNKHPQGVHTATRQAEPGKSPQNATDPNNHVRLNKALADAGICSRRKADEKIFAGLVQVNGEVVQNPGTQVNPQTDSILCEGKNLTKPAGEAPCWLMLHKPAGVVATASDPEGRPTVLNHVPPEYSHLRLYPVGRLDFFSEGLLLLTNDGPLAHRLTHPRWHIPREYAVTVRLPKGWGKKELEQALHPMRHGMTLAEGEKLAPVDVTVTQENAPSASGLVFVLFMVLHQGINRQIRRMCRDAGLTVLKLIRLSQGPLSLGDLQPGACRPLSPMELAALKNAAGM